MREDILSPGKMRGALLRNHPTTTIITQASCGLSPWLYLDDVVIYGGVLEGIEIAGQEKFPLSKYNFQKVRHDSHINI